MTEPRGYSTGTGILRPKARIMRTLGDELISSETVAVIELVKNAYDADATRVVVQFNESLDADEGTIEVIDNGHGMSLETIQSSWLEPATSHRKRKHHSEQRGRRVLGEKGIGRFATSRLANKLHVISRRTASKKEIHVEFDWTQFDDEQKYLDQVEVKWYETRPSEITPDGVMARLCTEEDPVLTKDDLSHGTILRLNNLRTTWSLVKFKELRTGLSRLISPFLGEQLKGGQDEFQIRLELPPVFSVYSGSVEPPDALRSPHYTIRGDVDATGNYQLDIWLKGQENSSVLEGRFKLQEDRIPSCGPFYIELRVWDRDTSLMEDLAHEYGSTLTNVRRDLNDAAGINIYRDGFRVLPYGEPPLDLGYDDGNRTEIE